jgi:23S rRNA (adenine-N6)-dimethyltransferase
MIHRDPNSLGQNFIKFPSLVRELFSITTIGSEDTVLEIGPGLGVITQELAKVCQKVIAVEKDKELAVKLKKKFETIKNVEIVETDFLDYPLLETDYKVFSNIPFSITAKIIEKFLEAENQPKEIYLLMQLETAEKYEGLKMESQASILTKPWYEIKIIGDIDRTSFTKKPQIDIVLIKFAKRENPFLRDYLKSLYFDFVKFGFSQWQPTFIKSWEKILTYKQLKTIEKKYHLTNLRPSEVSLDNWLLVFKDFAKIATAEQKEKLKG